MMKPGMMLESPVAPARAPSLNVRIHGSLELVVECGRTELPEDLAGDFPRVAVRRNLGGGLDPGQHRLQAFLPLVLRHPLVYCRRLGLSLRHRRYEPLAPCHELP